MRSRVLFYRVVPHNGGVVFAAPARAEFVARLHDAISTAKTWGEFRKLIPRAEYSKIVQWFDEMGEPRPASSESFDGEAVPGWSDGDYPPWLQKEMGAVLPIELLREFGTLTLTFVNGAFWMVPEKNLVAICDALRLQGWELRHCPEMQFW